MARTMTPILKSYLDKAMGPGGATAVLAAINSTHTAFDPPTRNYCQKMLDGIGAANDFETACTSNTASATEGAIAAMMNRLEHELGGRGNAEELILCIADGTIT